MMSYEHYGFRFTRDEDGSVLVSVPGHECRPMTAEEWAHLVACMSAGGSEDGRVDAAKAFHESAGPARCDYVVSFRDHGPFTFSEADRPEIEEGHLVVRRGGALLAIIAPGEWTGCCRKVTEVPEDAGELPVE
jgi:hypothetical protein